MLSVSRVLPARPVRIGTVQQLQFLLSLYVPLSLPGESVLLAQIPSNAEEFTA